MYNKEYQHRYYLDHREYILKKRKENYDETPDVYKDRTNKYKKENKEKISERNSKYRKVHREHINEYQKEYYSKKKEQG